MKTLTLVKGSQIQIDGFPAELLVDAQVICGTYGTEDGNKRLLVGEFDGERSEDPQTGESQ